MASVAVFCSSSAQLSPIFFSETEVLARSLVRAGHKIVFGGTDMGLMGHLASQALHEGGEVTGILCENEDNQGLGHKSLTHKTVVASIGERKREILKCSDAFVALPGGVGTLDEVTEIIALRQVGEVKSPLILLNLLGFWEPLVEMFSLLVQQNMVSQPLEELFTVLDTSQDVIEYLKANPQL